MPRVSLHYFILACALAASGCARLETPSLDVALPDIFRQAVPPDPEAPKPDPTGWWHAFQDPTLDAALDLALAENLSIQQSRQRILSARAVGTANEATLLPSLGASGGASFSRRLKGDGLSFSGPPAGTDPTGTLGGLSIDKTTGSYQGGFDASWELPLFGAYGGTKQAARAGVALAEANADSMRASVAAEVVRTYLELRSAQAQAELLRKANAARETTVTLLELKRSAGLVAETDVSQAATALAQGRAALPQAEQNVAQKLQRLAVLCGRATPLDTWAAPAPIPVIPAIAFDTLPADLLRSRPQIRAAEATVSQRAGQASIAASELYPQLRLSGSLSANGPLVGQSLTKDVINLSGGPSISIPLIDWGNRQATLEARQADWNEAALAYRQAVLEGIEETENALASVRAATERAERLTEAQKVADRALELTDLRYQAGLATQLDRLSTESTALQTAIDAADASAQRGIALAALTKALGGAALPVKSE